MDLRGLPRCLECGWRRPGRAPACAMCSAWVETDLDEAWHRVLLAAGMSATSEADQRAFAIVVEGDPENMPWRVFDAALARLRCPDCGDALGSGPVGCPVCDDAHGRRWLAIEADRPTVPAGNEHAIRVATAVTRTPHRFPGQTVLRYAFTLPLLHVGYRPSGADARAAQQWLDDGGSLEVLDRAESTEEISRLIRLPPR